MRFHLKRIVLGIVAPIVVALFGAAASANCSSPETKDVLPSALVVVKDAQNVKGSRDEDRPDRISVSYTVRAPYPAAGVLAEVSKRLEGSGWRPLPMDWINEMRPSSQKVGWRSHVTQHPEQENFNWSGQWSNSAGDVVEYLLRYTSRPPKPNPEGPRPNNEDLRVFAHLKPNRLVPVEALPASLIVANGARDAFAWQDHHRTNTTGVRYTVAAPRPPSELMSTIDERLARLGWEPVAVMTAPPWVKADPRTPAPKPGWAFAKSPGGYGGFFGWRADWRNEAGDSVIYVLSYDGAAPAPAAGAATDELHVSASLRSKAK